MRPTFLLLFSFGAAVFVTTLAYGQIAPNEPGVLNKTTFGTSQNDDRDLANSLVAGPQKYGKGEKKLQVSASELKTKSIKDATFNGSLLNIGIDPTAPKLDASKEHSAPSEESSTQAASTGHVSSASTQSQASGQESSASTHADPADNSSTFSNLSQTATLAEVLSQSDIAAVPATDSKTSSNSNAPASSDSDTQKKDQGGAEKPSTTSSTEKSSNTKPDSDH
jgi:hypothetical protein